MKWQINHGSAYEIIHNTLGFRKVCARWISKQLTMLHKHAWTSANKIWISMIKKMTPSWSESSLVTKHGSTITSQSVNGKLWNGNTHNRPSGKSSKANHQQEN